MAKKEIVVTERNVQYNERLKTLLEASDIFRPVVASIQLKEDGERWHLLWVNTKIHDMQYEAHLSLGYRPVKPEELTQPVSEVGAYVSPEGAVARGPQSAEVLMKVPLWYDRERQMKKAKRNIELTYGDPKKVKNDVINAVANEHGDQAASFVGRMTITDSRRPYEYPDQ